MAESKDNMEKLQVLEQNLQSLISQKQTFQTNLLEIENALKEVEKTKDNPFKLVGGVMVESNKKDVVEELRTEKDMVELRLKTLEKQENKLKDELKSVQEEVMQELKKKQGG